MEKFALMRDREEKLSNFNALIAAAGQGTRCGGGLPKQYRVLAGKPLLRHTIEAFIGLPGLQRIKVIIDPAHEKLFLDAIKGLKNIDFVHGGNSRRSSVRNGLSAFSDLKDSDILLIHDAARPMVRRNDIKALLGTLNDNKAATLATPITDTVKYENKKETIARDGLYSLQTPQGFHYGTIKKAHASADPQTEYTDDTGLVSALGIPVKLVQGHKSNFKITTEDDFEMAEKLMMQHEETRTGMGFDVHAFADTPATTVMLCGVSVPHNRPLSGHSDADVGLHALTDAILGSIAAGDIGQHFPPSDNTYKNMDSAVFLRRAVELLQGKGGRIVNLDVTLICEAPKIGPHRHVMEKRIAEIAGIEPQRVSVKATTTERLGFTGRGEGIAAQAIATVRLPRES